MKGFWDSRIFKHATARLYHSLVLSYLLNRRQLGSITRNNGHHRSLEYSMMLSAEYYSCTAVLCYTLPYYGYTGHIRHISTPEALPRTCNHCKQPHSAFSHSPSPFPSPVSPPPPSSTSSILYLPLYSPLYPILPHTPYSDHELFSPRTSHSLLLYTPNQTMNYAYSYALHAPSCRDDNPDPATHSDLPPVT